MSCCDQIYTESYNIVRDYNMVQGTTNPADLAYQIIRDVNVRYVTVENSSNIPVGIAITLYLNGPLPMANFVLNGGEIKHLAINPQGGPAQFIHMLNFETGLPVGNPTILARNSNSFVLRNGSAAWFVQKFSRPSLSASY